MDWDPECMAIDDGVLIDPANEVQDR